MDELAELWNEEEERVPWASLVWAEMAPRTSRWMQG